MAVTKKYDEVILLHFRTPDDTSEELIRRVSLVLLQLGIPYTFTGYQYLHRMICLAYKSPASAELITKNLYPQAAKEFHCGISALDHACRRALDQAYKTPYVCLTDDCGHVGPCGFVLQTTARLHSGE